LGYATAWDGGSNYPLEVTYSTSTAVHILSINSASTYASGNNLSSTSPFTWANGNAVHLTFRVPITGWSSNVQLSSDTDTRVVAAKYIGNDSASLSATPVVIKGFTKDYDTHGMINSATGAITIPVPGIYEFTVEASCNALTTAANQYFNFQLRTGSTANAGTIKDASYQRSGGSGVYGNMIPYTFTLNCLAGDVYSFQAISDFGASRALQNDGFVAVKRLSGPSVIAASESVVATYADSAGAAYAATTVGDALTFNTKEKDKDPENNSDLGH
jgi:hypothetical protein